MFKIIGIKNVVVLSFSITNRYRQSIKTFAEILSTKNMTVIIIKIILSCL